MNGRVTSSNDTVLPIVAANATSSTTTRPCSRSARGSARGDANHSCGIWMPDGGPVRVAVVTWSRFRGSVQVVHGNGPAVVQIDLAHGPAIAALGGPRREQAQRALAAVGDQRAPAPGGDLTERCAVDPHLDR